jgi:purine-binding chemotaxis protein CheW
MDESRCLCFNLGNEEYAVPLLKIKEVIAKPELTPLPQSPSYFLGIMNLRGQIVSILDLRIKLGIKPSASRETSVMILDLGAHSVGVVVDQVNAVQLIKNKDISEKPSLEQTKNHDYITGVFKRNEKLVFLLDISKSLSIDDKNRIETALKAA